VNATALANTAALWLHPRQDSSVVANVVLLDEVGAFQMAGDNFWKRSRRAALRGGRLGLPPGSARLLTLEPDEQTLAREADNAAAAEHRHRRVLQRPTQNGLLGDPHQVGDLPGGEIDRLGGGFGHGISSDDGLWKLQPVADADAGCAAVFGQVRIVAQPRTFGTYPYQL
jgi:hypothetical protein